MLRAAAEPGPGAGRSKGSSDGPGSERRKDGPASGRQRMELPDDMAAFRALPALLDALEAACAGDVHPPNYAQVPLLEAPRSPRSPRGSRGSRRRDTS